MGGVFISRTNAAIFSMTSGTDRLIRDLDDLRNSFVRARPLYLAFAIHPRSVPEIPQLDQAHLSLGATAFSPSE
jgi:hypothetical protein